MPLTGEASHRFLRQPPDAKAFLFPWSCVHARSPSGKKKCVCIPSSPQKDTKLAGESLWMLSKADSQRGDWSLLRQRVTGHLPLYPPLHSS